MKRLALALVVVALSGCGTLNKDVSDSINKSGDVARNRFVGVGGAPLQSLDTTSRVVEIKGRVMPAVTVNGARAGEWLRKFRVEKFETTNPVPLSQIQKWLTEQGINVVSDMPLDSISFSGKINPTDAETALKAISGSVGLDFNVDDQRRLVIIKPMSTQTWSINIGNRKSTYTSANNSGAGIGTTAGNPAGGGTTPGAGGYGGGGNIGGPGMGANQMSMGGAQPGMGAGGNANSGSNTASGGVAGAASGTNLVAGDDFWGSLASELKARLKVMVPKDMLGPRFSASVGAAMVPGINAPQPGAAPSGMQELYVQKEVGTFSINPETGAVTVQAPSWILRDLDVYFKSVQEMYNTDITFIGEVVLVTTTDQESEGMDIAAIASWAAGKWGAVVSNNVLGGITISGGAGGPSVVAGAPPVGGALVGATYQDANNAFKVFNAYLSQRGNVSIMQKPMVTTTSGVPGVFEKKVVDYYNTVTQQASTGSVGTSQVATQNILVPYETGTELRVIPRIDIFSGLIRSPLVLNMVLKTGDRSIQQSVSSNNTVQTINQLIPKLTQHRVQGEVLLRDGDLIVVGGQVDDQDSMDSNGLPSASSGPIGGIFGVKRAQRALQTYYIALRVVVNKRQ